MVDFVRKRLQVFVSSTYIDLKHERQAAVEAILTAGHIPAGMELFTSGSESQWDVIKQWIDESDIYMLILGGRYGSIEPHSGKSYTQLEYEYALEKGKPLFACVVNDAAQELRVHENGMAFTEQEEPKKLKEFRTLASSKMVRFWDDYKDIKIAVNESLSHLSRNDDLRGWVRENSTIDAVELVNQLSRLSAENSRLQEHNIVLQQQLTHQQTVSNVMIKAEDVSIGGLKFEEVEQLIEKGNLFSSLVSFANRYKNGGGVVHVSREDVVGLEQLGLVERTSDRGVQISSNGKLFYNKWVLKNSE